MGDYAQHSTNPSSRVPAEERQQPIADKARARFLEVAAPIARTLEGRDYLLGAFSAVDVQVGSILSWAFGLKLLEELPVLRAYVERLRARPAFQRSRAD